MSAYTETSSSSNDSNSTFGSDILEPGLSHPYLPLIGKDDILTSASSSHYDVNKETKE
jgi:hypothetical protein